MIVTKSPVTSITVDDITVGYESFVFSATGTYYEINPKVNVQMEDGTTAVLSPKEVFTWQNRDYTISLSDMNDIDYTSDAYPLSPDAYGVNILHAHFMGKTVPFKVTLNTIQSIRLDDIAYQDYRYTFTYTAQKTDDTVCTGSFSIPQPVQFGECTIFDKTLGSVTLAYDDTYTLRIGAHRIPLTTGETVRLYSERGDADGNGSVDIQDATLIQRSLAEFDDVSLNRNEYPERFYAADVTALQRMLAS